jgi:NTP pyrophosphatase (non-canonical NTP hydrolase)
VLNRLFPKDLEATPSRDGDARIRGQWALTIVKGCPVKTLEDVREALRLFVAERDWDQFHNPKNLVMALVAEAGELVEHFQWLAPEQAERPVPEVLQEVELEVADVLLLLLRLCDRLGIDPIDAARKKLEINRVKYPIEKARGKSTKYDKL